MVWRIVWPKHAQLAGGSAFKFYLLHLRASMGLGGPQPTEVSRMMADQLAGLDDDKAWLVNERQQLSAASTALNKAFKSLRSAQSSN